VTLQSGAANLDSQHTVRTDPGEPVNLLPDGNSTNDPPADELAWLAQRIASVRTCKGTWCP